MRALAPVVLLAALLAAGDARAQATDGDPDAPATVAAAEAAVARLGGKTARNLVATVRGVPALAVGTGGATRGLEASVQDLAGAMRALGARDTGLEVRVELPADVLFDVDRAEIRPDAAAALATLGTIARAYTGAVLLAGHTDADGSDAHNLALSQRRAAAVRDWLVAKESIAPERIRTEGAGESRPVAPNDTAANKQRNRRVEVLLRKA